MAATDRLSHPPDLAVLRTIEQRVLWLAVRMVDHANRTDAGGIKTGGHQASSASMVSIMTALWFAHIGGDDKVAVKPHASPVYHAIKYLTGELDRSYLTRLRRLGGLQAYPSRTKDPDVADFSTGSVGLGAVAPLFSAAARRYVDHHFGSRPPARFIATVGDAELDEGNVWEAISEPALQGLGNVTLIIDLNRQSLDRVVPGIQSGRLQRLFGDAGWHVVEAKYGNRLEAAFARPGGESLRRHIDDMSNEEYQSLFAFEGADLRSRFLASAPAELKTFLDDVADQDLATLIGDLGGHDLNTLIRSYRTCDAETDRPSVVFAYTVKGWGLPIAGDPLNHSALLSPAQIDRFRNAAGLTPDTEWDRLPADSPEGMLCAAVGGEINNRPSPPRPVVPIASEISSHSGSRPTSTQEQFGRALVALGNDPAVAGRIVTVSPDVATSTNLGGWINKMGVFSPTERTDYFGDGRLLRWQPGPSGHHIELGISEMNLFLLLGQLGLAHDHHGEMLIPIGTVYDPFVLRGLDGLVYSLYNDSRFIVAGTPSGVSLAPEGGAHQSSITPSVGLELPGITYCEPTYGRALDWQLSAGISSLADPDGTSLYLRLSTRPIDQTPFEEAVDRYGPEHLRAAVLAGGYRLREPSAGGSAGVVLAGSGPTMPEVLAAADLLEEEGIIATVLDLTSLDRLFHEWRRHLASAVRSMQPASATIHLENLIPENERRLPIVTIHDASSHAMSWIGSVFGQRVMPIGVDRFGESGTIDELYESFGLLPDQIVNAAVAAVNLRS
ncbi:MAG: 1-deoxy-D-xylulose-5-phosphate synthase N-terminal domain-containing protein [Acidimicrobiia bacterium]|nr:1-deoxy-D-xylulose-5-phosphate synthase N-terminal domain-containing protein [Acidimicrobiia bacterium]